MFSADATPEEFENGGFTLKTHQMFSAHATPVEFENGGFTLKTHQMFSVHATPKEFKNVAIAIHFRKTLSGKSRDYHDAIAFEKLRFHNVFVHTKTQSRCFQIPLVSRAFW